MAQGTSIFQRLSALGKMIDRDRRRDLRGQVSDATGKLTVDPVCNFDQSDLCADDVMLLDTVASVYIWVGQAANDTERSEVRLRSVMCFPLLLCVVYGVDSSEGVPPHPDHFPVAVLD